MSQASAFLNSRSAAIGSWRLHPGHAMSLRPKKTAVLRVFCGKVWVTLGETDSGVPGASGDRFLEPGDMLVVPAGVRLVMEPFVARGERAPVHFDWSDRPASRDDRRFAREVLAPSRELGAALGQAGLALLRTVRGLLGYGEFLIAGRGRVLSPLESMRS